MHAIPAMRRHDFLRLFTMGAASRALWAQRSVGLPPLKIEDVKVVATSPPRERGGK